MFNSTCWGDVNTPLKLRCCSYPPYNKYYIPWFTIGMAAVTSTGKVDSLHSVTQSTQLMYYRLSLMSWYISSHPCSHSKLWLPHFPMEDNKPFSVAVWAFPYSSRSNVFSIQSGVLALFDLHYLPTWVLMFTKSMGCMDELIRTSYGKLRRSNVLISILHIAWLTG